MLVALVLLILAGSVGWLADEHFNHSVDGYRLEEYGHNVTVGQVNATTVRLSCSETVFTSTFSDRITI